MDERDVDMDEWLADDELADEYTPPLPLNWLMERLDEPDPQVRVEAIKELWEHVDPQVMERLFELAENDQDERVRCRAISGLGRYVWECEVSDPNLTDLDEDDEFTPADLDRLRKFLFGIYRDESRSLNERRFAIEALSFLHEPAVDQAIMALYERPEKEARLSALFSMGRNGSEQWESILAREIWSEDKEIRIEAINAIGEMRADSFGKDLWRLTYDPDRDVMMAAIFSLGQTGWEDAFDRLDELTLDPDPEIRQVADAALEEWMIFSQIDGELEDEDWDEEEADELDEESDWM